jgi:hypothetical protein
MKPVRWSPHARGKIAKREIDQSEAELTLSQPDSVVGASPIGKFYQRRYVDKLLNQEMLLRILVEESESELIVITLYKTSKLTKYETK